MDVPSSLLRLRDWFVRLGKNPYFWSGIGGLLVIGVGVYFVFNSVVMPSYTRHEASVQVPDVTNRPFEDAKSTVESKGLTVQQQEGRFNPRVPQGRVVDQNPPPEASVKPGRRVYLTVNSGTAPTVSVPDLSGTSLREARNRLTSLGLVLGRERIDPIPSPYAETVTRQEPAPGDTLKKGSAVDVWYSQGLGSERVSVPNVQGLRVDVAEDRLLRQRLRSVVIGTDVQDENASETEGSAPSEADTSGAGSGVPVDEPPRWVRSQGLDPGTRVRSGTEVRLFVTSDSTAVPDPTDSPPVDSLDGGSEAGSDAGDEGNGADAGL